MSTQSPAPNNLDKVVGLVATGLVTAQEFAALLQISKRTLFRLRANGDLPLPIEISTNIIRWRCEDVRAYLDGLQPRKVRRRPGEG